MRWVGLVVIAGATSVFALHGCGLDVVGVASDADASSVARDASDEAPPAPSVADAEGDAPSCTCAAPPEGFTIVAVSTDPTAPCAGGLIGEDLVSEPVAGPGACSCGACAITMPTCSASTFSTTYDSSSVARCDLPSNNPHATNGCVGDNGFLSAHARVIPPAPQGGSCTSAAAADPARVTSTPIRLCRAPGGTCACGAASFATCFAAKGDVACPASAPNKRLVAKDVDVTCGACTCELTGAACRATVTWYRDDNCATPLSVINSDACLTQDTSVDYRSIRYAVEPRAACAVGDAPAGTATVREPETVCCPSVDGG